MAFKTVKLIKIYDSRFMHSRQALLAFFEPMGDFLPERRFHFIF